MIDRSLLFLFIDGLGIGPGTPGANPFAEFDAKVLRLKSGDLGTFPRDGICIPTNVCLGIPGLPQSATGQTTLFTGVNAAQFLGRHLQGFPNASLKKLIATQSLFRKMKGHGFRVTFANAFTSAFFQNRPRWVSATTVMSETAGVALRNLTSDSLYMDFTNRFLSERGVAVPLRGPQEAADILIRLTENHELCLYEYFLTDLLGHRGTFNSAVSLLLELDRFLLAIVESLDLRRTSLIITSDHGNIEDMSHSQHTLNPVPTLLWGDIQSVFLPFTKSLTLEQITPLIGTFFRIGEAE